MIFLVLVFLLPIQALALLPEEVLVVANRFVPESVDLARYYMKQRGIPKSNLLKITTTEKETCSRKIYDREIAKPVRKFLLKKSNVGKFRALVTIRGVPLRVGVPELNREEKKQVKELQTDQARLKEQLEELPEDKNTDRDPLKKSLSAIKKQIKILKKGDYAAAVDSELALVLSQTYNLKFWQPNPYFVGYKSRSLELTKDDILFVSRLDGPTVDLVRRIIDDSLFAEEHGLDGRAYFDAKASKSKKKQLKGYALYDNSLHLAAARVKDRNLMVVIVNEKKELFQPGEATYTALYCGWYSLARYVDAFDWNRGAIGYHIASQECQTLRAGSGNYWCKRMLEDGAAAVIGPVGEPYVQAFPIPEIFFSYLTDGYYTLAEAYFLSLPYLSWQMVLVGDPLYRPFKNR
ncbi:MAG: TIGR03790 family protein [Thermodesulfobacteriota bacterium]|nr:TIGR03790 family protein [Thermodesulfobacteriota bacterium]